MHAFRASGGIHARRNTGVRSSQRRLPPAFLVVKCLRQGRHVRALHAALRIIPCGLRFPILSGIPSLQLRISGQWCHAVGKGASRKGTSPSGNRLPAPAVIPSSAAGREKLQNIRLSSPWNPSFCWIEGRENACSPDRGPYPAQSNLLASMHQRLPAHRC